MLEKKEAIPVEIEESEPLLRAVSTPSGLDSENMATPLAFRLRAAKKERSLSLSRNLYEELKAFLKRSLRFDFSYLTPKDVVSGALELNAGEVRGLDEHIELRPTPGEKTPAHASIFFKKEDGSYYTAGEEKDSDPVNESILGYEMALASIVRKIYDKDGNVIWERDSGTHA